MFPDFRGKVVVEVAADINVPNAIAQRTASEQSVRRIHLNGALSFVTVFVGDDLLDVVEYIAGAMMPPGDGCDLNFFARSRKRQLQDNIAVDFIDSRVKGCVGKAKYRRNKRESSRLMAGIEDVSLKLLGGHGADVGRASVGRCGDLAGDSAHGIKHAVDGLREFNRVREGHDLVAILHILEEEVRKVECHLDGDVLPNTTCVADSVVLKPTGDTLR